jgi:hypothetical protein
MHGVRVNQLASDNESSGFLIIDLSPLASRQRPVVDGTTIAFVLAAAGSPMSVALVASKVRAFAARLAPAMKFNPR